MGLRFDSFTLAAATADLGDEPVAREHADCVEFRMDLAERPLDALAAYDGELPLIATNRAAWEGGGAGEEGRLDALAEAARHDAVGAVDVELESLRRGEANPLLDAARDREVRVIASVHDFEGTPSTMEMRELLSEALAHGDVGKLAVTAGGRADVLSLLSVTHDLSGEGPIATMAMGEAGRHSRAVAPLYGSVIGYAPVRSEEATAPGQFDLATLAELIDRLR
ncbi:type I 3-dehydroquinate dehydratase [Natronorarus salvus]|uniref:type I 3-dehydroquinate dehydratase n=1 Tax=Natronorarus salvus TaxID=3117733 RepID=UPI002F26D103